METDFNQNISLIFKIKKDLLFSNLYWSNNLEITNKTFILAIKFDIK